MFQQTLILGRFVKDPELKYLQNGTAMTKFNVVTSRSYFATESQEWKEQPEYHTVTVFGKSAQGVCKFCKKGHLIFIVGRNKTSSYEKDGQKHWRTEVIAEPGGIHFLTPKGKGENQQSNDGEEQPKSKAKSQQKTKQPDPPADEMPPDDYSDEPVDQGGSDDIPF